MSLSQSASFYEFLQPCLIDEEVREGVARVTQVSGSVWFKAEECGTQIASGTAAEIVEMANGLLQARTEKHVKSEGT